MPSVSIQKVETGKMLSKLRQRRSTGSTRAKVTSRRRVKMVGTKPLTVPPGSSSFCRARAGRLPEVSSVSGRFPHLLSNGSLEQRRGVALDIVEPKTPSESNSKLAGRTRETRQKAKQPSTKGDCAPHTLGLQFVSLRAAIFARRRKLFVE